jgi:hypothetical protein
MTTTHDAFFEIEDDEVPAGVPRDQWKRPLILQDDGSLIGYTRASSLANQIDNFAGLHKWDTRHIARGIGIREDLAAMAAALPVPTGDKRKDAPTNAALDEIIEAARETAGEHVQANWGTAVHSFTEPGQEGNPAVPERMKADVDSYWKAKTERGLICLASEVFVVNDELKVAGTFDDLYWDWAYGLIVGDKKTGKQKLQSTLIQMAIYANSYAYNWETGERYPLSAFLPAWIIEAIQSTNGEHFAGTAGYVNRDTALYVHIPAGEGVTEFLPLDIATGWEAARVAAWVRDYKRRKDLVKDLEPVGHVPARMAVATTLKAAIDSAPDAEAMKEIWKTYEIVWTDALSAYAMRALQAKRRG